MTIELDRRLDQVEWDASEPGRSARMRATVLAAVSTVGLVVYLVWILQPGRVGNPLLFWLLIVAEVFNMIQAIGFWWTCLTRRPTPRAASSPDGETWTPVDVFIPTYNEPVEIVRATVVAASRMRGQNVRVALLDDGDRTEMADLALECGVRYIRRDVHQGAKAGNINHALAHTDAPFVVVLDCDHVPQSDLVVRMLDEFVEDRIAFVQTPQYYANARDNRVAGASWGQQALFFGAISRGKDAHGAMFCCGTNVMLRRTALDEVGGFPEGSLTEDFTLSVALHENGWRTRYLPEVLASGLGPEDLASYTGQQRRWARGCVGTIPRILRSSLSLRMKAQYLLSASYFLTGWAMAVYLMMPLAYLLFGAQPLNPVGADSFLLVFAPYFIFSLATVASMGGGSYTFAAYSLAVSSFWIHISSSWRLLLSRTGRFVVTPKTRSSNRQWRPALPALVTIGILLVAIVVGVSRGLDAATVNNIGFALMHIAILASGVAVAVVPSLAVTVDPTSRGSESLARTTAD